MKDLRASTIIAALALFVLIGGSATAASGLINGKKIKPGTITAKQIANRTITTSKISPGAVRSLRGRTGTAGTPGATGPVGSTGVTGATGPAGVISPLYAEAGYLNLDENDLLNLDVPTDSYMITAKLNLTSNTADAYVNCSIWVDGTSAVDQAIADPVAFNETVPMSLMAVSEVAGEIAFRCNGYEVMGNARDVKLIAMPLSG